MLPVKLLAFVPAASLALSVQGQVLGGGIALLTAEAHQEAVQCGRAGAPCAVTPYVLCPSGNGGYEARIASPFSRVASAIFEASKKHRRSEPMSAGVANGWGVGIYVSPVEEFQKAGSIQKVTISRDGRTVVATTSTLAPVIVSGPRGERRQMSKGFFSFPLDVFSPSSDITVVFLGSGGEIRCPISRQQLSSLR
jgi:hypothetical protein